MQWKVKIIIRGCNICGWFYKLYKPYCKRFRQGTFMPSYIKQGCSFFYPIENRGTLQYYALIGVDRS